MTLSCVSSCKVTQKAHFSPFFSFPSCSFLSNILPCGSWRFVVLCCCGVCCELLSPYLTEISMVFCLYPLSREEWNRIPNFLPPKESLFSLAVQNSSIGHLVCLSVTTNNQTLQSDPRYLWPLRHLIRGMRRHYYLPANLPTYLPTYLSYLLTSIRTTRYPPGTTR